MAITEMNLVNEMNHVVDHCYIMDNQLIELSARTQNQQLQEQFADSAHYYKTLGDHLFLVLASEGYKLEKLMANPEDLSPQWTDVSELETAAGDLQLLRLVIRGNKKAKADLANAFNYSEISPDLAMVVRNGILEINSILDALQSNDLLTRD